MATSKKITDNRKRRQERVRLKLKLTASRPRLSVYRSLNHIYAQVIDDEAKRTVAAASTAEPELREQAQGKTKSQVAALVGQAVGKRAIEQGVNEVAFDRGRYKFHGRVKAVADGAREAGLVF